MSPLLSICIVVVTIALVVLAVAAFRVLVRVGTAVERATETMIVLTKLLEDATRTSAEFRELAESLEGVSKSLREPAARLGEVGDRIASTSSGLLDQVEDPLRRVVSLVQMIKSVVRALTGAPPQQAPSKEGS